MGWLPGVDFIITSPPYDDLRDYKGYKFDFESIARSLYKVLKEGGVMIWVVSDAVKDGSESGTSFRQALYFKEIGFRLHDTMIYYKNNPVPQSGKRYNQHFEYMFAFSKGVPGVFNPIMEDSKYSNGGVMRQYGRDGVRGWSARPRNEKKKRGNVFSYSIGGGHTTKDKIAFEHPAIFPELLVRDQLLTWTNEGDLVYDPFMGSGTTAKVCRDLKRHYVGSEISKDYVAIAHKRLSSGGLL